ncbi:MAG: hypothetical protein ACREND_07480 [Gemmatimonadaceae bacterium]
MTHVLERFSGRPADGAAQRISWPQTLVQFYVVPKVFLILGAASGLVFAFAPSGHHRWAHVAAGLALFAACCARWRRVDASVWEVWLLGETLILTRHRSRVQVPLDCVTSIELPARADKVPIILLKRTDGPGVTRMCRFAAPESPAWRALRERLAAQVPPVSIVSTRT